jgi:ATP-dependent exoDNAse (exonuclease V) beta subunit
MKAPMQWSATSVNDLAHVIAANTSPEALAAMDARARERAIDPTLSILLRAPAGSGKTTVLTQRLLRLLAEVDAPEEILAITFTRKAAAEMRERVLKVLHGEIDASHPQAAQMQALASAVRERDAQRGWGLAGNPGRLRVQTIDSFNFWLASQLPIAAQAGGALVVAERPGDLYRRAARRVLIAGEADENLAADIELLFERIDNRWGQVERLLAEMLAKRGHWLRYVLAEDEHALSARVSASLADIAVEHLRSACEQISAALRNTASALPGVGSLGADAAHVVAWHRLAALTLTNEGTWRKQVTKRLGMEFEHNGNKEHLRNCIELLTGVPGARELLVTLSGLPAPMLSGEDAAAIEALSRVLREAAKELQVEFSLAGKVDYTYVAGAARAALTEDGEPTDLGLRAGLSLRHILIDEFQDTSIAQFELLEALTATWEPGDGRTLFAVGDPMQSIYQFREAEVGLFLRAGEQGVGNVAMERLQLTRNFRSTPSLVDWTNSLFTQLFPPVDDVRASAVAFTPSLAAREPRPGDVVSLSQFSNADREAEGRLIAEGIVQIREASPEATVAILVVSRSHAPLIMAALAAADVDAIGVDLVPLRDLSIVRDLVALLKALHHTGDRTAWLAVLRAPWCGVSLPTLSQLSMRGDSQLLREAMFDAARLAACDPADVTRLTRVRAVLEEAVATRDRVELAAWLEAVWLRLGAPDAYPAADLTHARAFFGALGSATARAEWRGPQDVDALVADLFAEPRASTANPVQVMTIHRSKGLEFDHVFLPALDRILNRDRDPLLRWLDLPREGGGSDLLMAPVPTIGDTEGGALNAYLKRLMSARLANEQTRLLYVAMTRAKRSLHLSAAQAARKDGTVDARVGTLLRTLWPVLASSFVDASTSVAGVAPPETPVRKLRRLAPTWQPPVIASGEERSHLPIADRSLEPQAPEFSWVQETSRHIGTVVHAALERFASGAQLPTREAVEKQAAVFDQQLRRHGVPEKDLERATRTVMQALLRTLGDERGRWIFSPAHREAQSELALTGIASGSLTNVIIDRTFVDESGTRWVIDFKTSRHEGAKLEAFLDEEIKRYRNQLERNVALARGLGPQPVRAALYFPLMSEFRVLPEAKAKEKGKPGAPAQGELF